MNIESQSKYVFSSQSTLVSHDNTYSVGAHTNADIVTTCLSTNAAKALTTSAAHTHIPQDGQLLSMPDGPGTATTMTSQQPSRVAPQEVAFPSHRDLEALSELPMDIITSHHLTGRIYCRCYG